jgi:UDP-N-acetylglucosamine 2-epimerase (non-hydrolysing)
MTRAARIRPLLIASGQHRALVAEALESFSLSPDRVLRLTRRTGALGELLATLTRSLDQLFVEERPAVVIVQGDTTTALVAAMVAFMQRIPVVHLEAGLRSHNLAAPFPEEANRKMISQIAALHLAPTTGARDNLCMEGLAGPNVFVIGNTVVDAVLDVAARARACRESRLEAAVIRAQDGVRKLVLVTAHRRESWGTPLDEILRAVADLVTSYPDIEVVLPTHPNPVLRKQVHRALSNAPRVLITKPLPYADLVRLLSVSTLALSDSGGLQEEAPSFSVPVLVLREVTERIEAITSGCALLVGTNRRRIFETASWLLTDAEARRAMTAAGNPFGDGRAAERAEQAISWLLNLRQLPPDQLINASSLPRPAAGGRQDMGNQWHGERVSATPTSTSASGDQ